MSQSFNLMCALGFHSWSEYGEVFSKRTWRDIGYSWKYQVEQDYQEKTCKVCGMKKRIEVGDSRKVCK